MRRISNACGGIVWRRICAKYGERGDLRAGADWHALGAEYWGDGPPSTPLGEQDNAFWRR